MGTADETAGVVRRSRRRISVTSWAGGRTRSLDNLKVILIGLIIAVHGVVGYVGYDQLWSYADVQEVTLHPVTEGVLFVVIAPFALFMIALLFLVAGLLSRPSLDRKGPGRFAADRLLRLGVPFALFTFGAWPLLMYALYHPLGGAPGPYWTEFLDERGRVDTGPLWFVGVLLIFSLGYAALAAFRRRWAVPADADPGRLAQPRQSLSSVHLSALAAAVAAATFVVRVAFPLASEDVTDLNVWEWPACIALFTLGVATSRRGWLTAVPHHLRTQCRLVTLCAAAAMALFGLLALRLGFLGDVVGGWSWPALLFSALESILTVFGSVWLLGAAHRHLDRELPLGPILARSSYAAFLVQGVVLIGLAVAMRPVPVIAEVKAIAVAVGGVTGSFALGWLLVSRVPGIARLV